MTNPTGLGSSLLITIVFATGLATAQASNSAAAGTANSTENTAVEVGGAGSGASSSASVQSKEAADSGAAEGITPTPTESVAATHAGTSPIAADSDTPTAPLTDGDGKKKGKKKDKGDKEKGANGDGESKLPWETKPKIRIGGLLHSQFAINDAADSADYDFRLTNARINLEWEQGSLLDAVAEVELSRDGDREATAWAPMRDAFVRVSPHRALRMRMGQFKRPFGKLSLTSLRELKLIRRGVSDVWINEELDYGERDVGFQVEGKIGRGYELNYALGVFNGRGRNRREDDPNGVKDLVGRLEGRLGEHLSIGVNGANKRFDTSIRPGYPNSAWMSGADVLVEYAGLYGLVEAQYGTNYVSVDRYHTGSLLALVAYRIPVTQTWQIAVEPLIKGEVLKIETEVQNRQILNGTAGVNLYVGKVFRLLVQGEWIAPKGPLPDNLGEAAAQKRLIIQAGMYTR